MAQGTVVERLVGARLQDEDVRAMLEDLDSRAVEKKRADKKYWLSKPVGLELHADARTGRITDVFAYGGGYEKYQRFSGELPGSVSAGLSRDQVRERLGQPDKSGTEHDFWERDAYDISVMYFPDGSIKKFVLMG